MEVNKSNLSWTFINFLSWKNMKRSDRLKTERVNSIQPDITRRLLPGCASRSSLPTLLIPFYSYDSLVRGWCCLRQMYQLPSCSSSFCTLYRCRSALEGILLHCGGFASEISLQDEPDKRENKRNFCSIIITASVQRVHHRAIHEPHEKRVPSRECRSIQSLYSRRYSSITAICKLRRNTLTSRIEPCPPECP